MPVMETTTTRRDAYMADVLDVAGPRAVRLVAERIADCETTSDLDEARAIVAGYLVDRESECEMGEPELWHVVTPEEAHEIRASVILDVAAELVRIANAASDEAYERRMSCRRRTNDCGCRTCGG